MKRNICMNKKEAEKTALKFLSPKNRPKKSKIHIKGAKKYEFRNLEALLAPKEDSELKK